MLKRIMRSKIVALGVFLHIGVSALSVNIVKNGDFNKVDKEGIPIGWKLGIQRTTESTMSVVDGGYNSRMSLHIKKNLPYGSGRMPLRQFLPLIPEREYELSCYSMGSGGGYLSFVLGNRWGQRLWIRSSDNWKKYIKRIVCKPDEFAWKDNYELCLLAEGKADALVSNICLRPLNALYSVEEDYSKYDSLYVVNSLESFSLNVEDVPSDLPRMSMEMVNKPGQGLGQGSIVDNLNDLSCDVAFAFDSKGLIFYAKVWDDKHYAFSCANMWNGDSIQLGINQRGDLGKERNDGDREIGFSFADGKAHNYDWTLRRSLNKDEMEYTVKPINNGYLVVARINWLFLQDIDRDGSGKFSINVVVNDTDDGVQRKALSLRPGIYSFKSNESNVLCLLKDNKSRIFFIPDSINVTNEFKGRIVLTGNSKDAGYSVCVFSEDGSLVSTMKLPVDRVLNNDLPMVADVRLDANKFSPGKNEIKLISENQVKAEVIVDKHNFLSNLKAELPLVKKRYEVLKNKIKQLSKKGIATERMHVACTIAERQFNEFGDMLRRAESNQKEADYNGRIGLRICKELNLMFDMISKDIEDIKKDGGSLFFPSRYQSSSLELKDGYFYGTVVDSKGKIYQRPVIFSGYGHFSQALKDIRWFPRIGVDFIQTEIGPNRVIVGENDDGSFVFCHKILDKKCSLLKQAWDSNVVVNLLLSPHYFPQWALDKHPECAWNAGGFLRYDVQSPYARKLIEAYIRELVSYVKNSPGAGAVHSICISNEPSFRISLRYEPFRLRFLQHLKHKYGSDISTLNSAWKTNYQLFSQAVPKKDPLADDCRGLYYDLTNYKIEEFAEWHNWMAELVRNEWPGMYVHSKVLTGMGTGNSTDYELFTEFSDVNGTDAHDSFTRALMTSMKPVHIVNSENHIIPDRHQKFVSYEEIFQKMFRQFFDGVGGSVVWVWEPYSLKMYEQKHDLDGNIYRRPLNILAVYDASVAANRLVNEIKYGFNVKPQVALLYSTTSAIHNPKYEKSSKTVWESMLTTGHKTGFISEKQLKEGQYGQLKLIVAVECSNIKLESVKALDDFVRKGGKVITIGKSFVKDQYGRDLNVRVNAANVIPSSLLGQTHGLTSKIKDILNEAIGKLPVRLLPADENSSDVNWRYTPTEDGGAMVYIENMSGKRVELELSRESRDMISGRTQPAAFALNPWELKLLKVNK
ncbi:MAG: beta-galactosidase [Victivallales bacterium]|nr:beta-galactosidase [Victivallales bacterium]